MKQLNQNTKFKYANKRRQGLIKHPHAQKGVALIMVLAVLFALTLLGLASTDSSSLQALMVRNSQFRLEAFNRSYNEIEDQLDFYVTDAGKAPLFAVIDNGEQSATSTATPTGALAVRSNATDFDTSITLRQNGGCPIYLNSLGTFKQCSLMELESESQYQDTNIGSEQVQQFSFTSF